MNNTLQLLMITVVFVVFSSVGLYYWNLAAIADLERQYSEENMRQAATSQFKTDIERGIVRIVRLFQSPKLYGSPHYPNVPIECLDDLVKKSMDTDAMDLLDVDRAYWADRYYSLYPGPYLYYAESYNLQAINYWLGEDEPCLLEHFSPTANSPNKGFNRTPISSGPAKPGESGGGAG